MQSLSVLCQYPDNNHMYIHGEKMMFYDSNGYIDVAKLMEKDQAVYKFIVGARGIGKTFGILKWMIDQYRDTGNKFVYLRRTQVQVDMIKTPELNPFKALEDELGTDYAFILNGINKNVTGIYEQVYDPEKNLYVPTGAPIGYILALSTIANIRGIGGSDIVHIFYDEFIGERHEKPIKSEGTAFLNALETIGRNRELKGLPPLPVTCASNSVNLGNALFVELKFITSIEKALKKGTEHIYLPDRDTSIYILKDNPISKKKAKTSLYRLAGTESDFSRMSLSNEFNREYMGQVKSRNLKDYIPLCNVGELCIYRHKARREWYITEHASGKPKDTYESSDIEIKRWSNDYYYLKLAYLNRHIFFESYIQQVLFERYMKI